MGRASSLPKQTKNVIIGLVIAAAAAGGIVGAVIANSPGHKVSAVVNQQHQLSSISYHGQTGVDALTLLKKHASITVKHYSFGDLVTSINGTYGNGPKYWTFYINGKMADIGAGAYKTKSSDMLEWKLQ